jgi:hypothetical protein
VDVMIITYAAKVGRELTSPIWRSRKMKTTSATIFSISLLIMAAALNAQPFREAKSSSTELSCSLLSSKGQGEVQLVAINNDVAVERIHGRAAAAHLENLLSRKPAAFVRAQQILRERGFTPTDFVYVERTLRRLNARLKSSSSVLPAQDYSEWNADGEIVFWSWTDGDDGTWEGSIYMEAYGDDSASTWEGQIDVSVEEYPWVYYSNTWTGDGDGGGDDGGGDPLPTLKKTPPRPGQIVPAVASSGYPSTMYMLVGWNEWGRCWRGCVIGNCTTAAIACRYTGPLWAKCFGGWCGGSLVGCGVGCYFM